MIVGRGAELAELRAALARADQGHAQVVCVVGGPGVGKTTLLDALTDGVDRERVVRLTGMPSESTLGYAGLAVLGRAMSEHLDTLPPRQRRAVDACMAEGDTSPGATVDLLALGSGLLTLLAEAAAEGPLLLRLDDLQWVDAESRRALGFAVRRLSTERVLVVLATRTESAIPDGLTRRMVLSPMLHGEALEILDALQLGLGEEDSDRIIDRAEGNPLAVVELGRGLAASRGGSATRPGRPPGDLDGLQSVFADQLAALSPGAADALLLAACDGRVDLALVALALGPGDSADDGVDELIASGLIMTTGTHASLRHPLLGAAVMAAAGPGEVRAAHARLAAALAPHDDARALWHQAQATVGPDEVLAARVAASGERARVGGRPDEASRSHELAARLTLRHEHRVAWLVAAAESAFVSADSARAARLAALAREESPSAPDQLARIQALEGQLGLRLGWRHALGESIVDACRVLERDRAVPLLLRVAREAVGEHDIETARRAVAQLESLGGGTPEFREVVLATCEVERTPDPPVATVERLTNAFDRPPSGGDVATLATVAGLAMEWGRIAVARTLFLHAGQTARASGDLDDIALVDFGVAFCDHALGSWTSAYARSREVAELLTDVDLPQRLCEALLLQAEIDAARGQTDRCREACARVREISPRLVDPVFALLVERREALLDLGLGRLEPAAVRLEASLVAARLHGIEHPYASPIPDLVEVYVRSGRLGEAGDVAQDFLDRVGPLSPPLPRARSLRITGLLAAPGSYDEAFTESVELDLSVGLLFHAARTLLCHGERLRRDRRRVEARARLQSALDLFQRLEATPWVRRCALELAASGAAVTAAKEADPSVLLTPQELQVAVLVAEGRRNREIADTLFLSLRTVESHLSRAFRKLGVDTRTQLSVRMNDSA